MTEAKIAQMYTALKRITLYDSTEKLRRHSEKNYGSGPEEALEYAYENVINEARRGLRGVRLPRAKKPKAADPQPQTAPSGEGKGQHRGSYPGAPCSINAMDTSSLEQHISLAVVTPYAMVKMMEAERQ